MEPDRAAETDFAVVDHHAPRKQAEAARDPSGGNRLGATARDDGADGHAGRIDIG
jgi:hypothetical protein